MSISAIAILAAVLMTFSAGSGAASCSRSARGASSAAGSETVSGEGSEAAGGAASGAAASPAAVAGAASGASAGVASGEGSSTGAGSSAAVRGSSEAPTGSSTRAGSPAAVRNYRAKVVREYPHDTGAYTQGLFFKEGVLYESTGQYGSSSFRIVDLETGKAVRKLDFDKKYFVEGSVCFGDDLYIMTWVNKVMFIYDINDLSYKGTRSYPREGWGLTTDGTQLIASDGSATLYFMNSSLAVTKRLTVRMAGRPVRFLNEIEYIDGKVWANVYTSDLLLIIDPQTGNVEATVDCTGILPDSLRTPQTDVLNGIAYNQATGKIYITGKNWPKLYEITLEEKK